MSIGIFIGILLTFSPYVYGARRQNQCEAPCANVFAAASVCSDAACLCPTWIPSGPSCSACLAEYGDPTYAATISSYIATVCVCSDECNSVSAAIATCSSMPTCVCPTLSAIAPPCISCWETLGYTSDASDLSSILYNYCPTAISAEACSNQCDSISSLVSSCSSKAQCICPTVSLIGPPCVSCLSALGFVSDASGVSTDLSSIFSACALIPQIEVCSEECSSVGNAVSLCSPNEQCLCQTLSVVGPACISCVSSLGDMTGAATLSSFLATDCEFATTPALQTPHQTPTVTLPAVTSTVTATSTQVEVSTTQSIVSKSGVQQGGTDVFWMRYFPTIIGIFIIAGSLSLFI